MTGIREAVDSIEKHSLDAYNVLSEFTIETPLLESRCLSTVSGCRVYLKLENLQLTGSFKVRGATYKTYRFWKQGYSGVVTASSGNHAVGVAFASRVFGVESVVVMPLNASRVKVEKARGYGSTVVLHGEVYDEAHVKAVEVALKMNYGYVHTYDDPEVIAGNSTVMYEVFNRLSNAGTVIAPIGGGGLISGLSVVAKRRGVKVIGVQTKKAPSMYTWFKEKRLPEKIEPTLADGVYVKKPGELTRLIVEEFVDDIYLVDEDEIVEAVGFIFKQHNMVVEGAGALPVALLLSGRARGLKEPVVAVITGGNIGYESLFNILRS